MALFEKLKDTKLKSLKFGEKGTKGDSTKPYIVTDINTVDTPLNKFRLTKFDDGLIRGGAVGAANASIMDTLRVGKFLTDFPKGPLFIVKQVGLQLTNSPLETKQMPTNRVGKGIIGKVAAGVSNVANKLNNLIGGPTRIYNLGINTLAQVPVNAFGGHINRHGFLPKLDPTQKYESVVTENNKGNNNRLQGLYNKFFQSNSSGTTFRSNVFEQVISDNFGGAKSVYGIGRTTIRRTTFTGRETDINEATNKIVSKTIQQGILEHVYDPNTIYQNYKKKIDPTAEIDKFKFTPSTASIDISTVKTNNGFIYINNQSEPTSSFTKRFKYDKKLNPINTYLNLDPTGKNDQNRYDLPEILPEDHINLTTGSYKVSNSGVSDRLFEQTGFEFVTDKIYESEYKPKTSNKKYNDLVTNKLHISPFTVPLNYDGLYAEPLLDKNGKPLPGTEQLNSSIGVSVISPKQYTPVINISKVKDFSNDPADYKYNLAAALENVYSRNDAENFSISFTPLNPFTGVKERPIIFTGYVKGYNETYDSSWDSIKYNGRSEFLYTFNSYKKTAQFKLQIPAFAYTQIETNHAKLKKLQEGLAGGYKNNRLGGIINYVYLGYYLPQVPCIITSLNISIPDEASWDLDTDQAMLLEANFSLIVIDEGDSGRTFSDPEPVPPKPQPVKPNPIPKIDPKPIPRKKLEVPAPPIKNVAEADKTRYIPGEGIKKAAEAKQKTLIKKQLTPQEQKALQDKLNPNKSKYFKNNKK